MLDKGAVLIILKEEARLLESLLAWLPVDTRGYTDMELEQVYRVKEIGKALSLTERSVYKLLSSGRLKGVKVGEGSNARWRIRASDLNDFLTASTKVVELKVSK